MSPISLLFLFNTLSTTTVYTVAGRVSEEKRARVSGFLRLELLLLPNFLSAKLSSSGSGIRAPHVPVPSGWGAGTVFWVLFHTRVFLTESHVETCSHVCLAASPAPALVWGRRASWPRGRRHSGVSSSLTQFLIQAAGCLQPPNPVSSSLRHFTWGLTRTHDEKVNTEPPVCMTGLAHDGWYYSTQSAGCEVLDGLPTSGSPTARAQSPSILDVEDRLHLTTSPSLVYRKGIRGTERSNNLPKATK